MFVRLAAITTIPFMKQVSEILILNICLYVAHLNELDDSCLTEWHTQHWYQIWFSLIILSKYPVSFMILFSNLF